MNQALYAHMNNKTKIKKKKEHTLVTQQLTFQCLTHQGLPKTCIHSGSFVSISFALLPIT
jgi:hypothetical protein